MYFTQSLLHQSTLSDQDLLAKESTTGILHVEMWESEAQGGMKVSKTINRGIP